MRRLLVYQLIFLSDIWALNLNWVTISFNIYKRLSISFLVNKDNRETFIGLSNYFKNVLALIVRRLLVNQLDLRCISVNLETSIGLSTSFRNISVNVETSIGLSISFKIYKG